MSNPINVFSEIGKLKSVLIHRPGQELENLTPDLLERLLFDEIPYQKVAAEEHDAFKAHLEANGVEVLYIEELVAKTLDENPQWRDDFINRFIKEAKINKKYREKYRTFISKKKNLDMVKTMIAGTKKYDLKIKNSNGDPFITEPLPNILFQRDPFASIGNGATIHKMWAETRNRETLFCDFVLRDNSRFANQITFYYTRKDRHSIEGGDIMVLNKTTLVIGLSQRTEMKAIKKVAKRIFNDPKATFEKIAILDLPKARAFMHLDTVFTNIDYDKFIVHPLIFDYIDQFKIWEITKDDGKKRVKKNLQVYLEELVGKKVKLIKCGGDDEIAAGREQWNDGTNVITLAPGKVIAYERNYVTIELLKKAGVKVLTIPSSELSRGRGGPRCMSMPLIREELEK
ncbi:Arginine deiminase [Spiroplasma sp. JKS002669]|uniref:arginine deiminase n=1 Tax=Spiroplasma attinicola TaxID=2904537 RepID=UPI002022FB85|nr:MULTISPECIES: arginine deiminase [unclassified Spiroplasma]MCL6428527.1 Arginine deiminase [Spiroplasma sp. JKS002669]MCL8209861.1 Arginine deiminase [Spiroplasma sp. JKS002670]MCL8210822.1 Arginine deiminase [Spiroplasma sp. JKS002671]